MSDLTDLGLSAYEASAYRAAHALGPAPARRIAATSDVPRGRVYDVLDSLSARGLVTARDDQPTRYEAVPPQEAVDRLLAGRLADLRAERERYAETAAAVADDLALTAPAEGLFWPAALGSDDARRLMREQFATADEAVWSAVGRPYDAADWPAFAAEADEFDALLGDALDVRLLLDEAVVASLPAAAESTLATLRTHVDVRTTDRVACSVDVVDARDVYVSVPDPFDRADRLGGLVLRDTALAESLRAAFADAWADATPL